MEPGEGRLEVCLQRVDVVDVPALEDGQDAGHVAFGDEPLVSAPQRGLDGGEKGHIKKPGPALLPLCLWFPTNHAVWASTWP